MNNEAFAAPMQFERIRIVEDCILETARGPYLVLHGDVFDGVIKNMVFLAHLGDIGSPCCCASIGPTTGFENSAARSTSR